LEIGNRKSEIETRNPKPETRNSKLETHNVDRSTTVKLVVAAVAFCGLFLGLATLGVFVLDRVTSPRKPETPESEFPDGPASASPVKTRAPLPEWELPLPDPPAQVEDWIAQLGSPDYAERVDASNSLVALGKIVVPSLEQALGHPDPEIRWRAKEALRRIKEKR